MVRANLCEEVSMAGVSPGSFAQQLPTPSPFSFSVASTRWSSRPPIHLSGLYLRFLALVLSFVSALSLANPPKSKGQGGSSFDKCPELMYCFVVSIVAFVYSAFQLFKGVCDISYRGIVISDKMVAYLLTSSSSVGILAIQQAERNSPLWKAAIISVSMSFAIFVVVATCALFSGYKLCKRISW
ncbi:hypothetical protein CRG98_014283 [Punica granatum]|uniref:CASP-like protein n=1 Tax=Punica granatum TaxID=22663 RepID=A0A2I0K9V2_PUNGR|nr:hypothetical protein CRG98_014283 [Punica granatum]